MIRVTIPLGIILMLLITLPASAQTQMPSAPLTLERAIEIALDNKVDVEIAKERQHIAAAEKSSAWNNYLPSISANASGSRTRQGEGERFFNGVKFQADASTNEYFETGVSVNQTIYAGGAIRNSNKLADIGLDQSEVQYESTREEVILNVTSAYLDLLRAHELIKVYSKTLESSQAQVGFVRERYNLGAVAKNDVLKAETRAGSDKINLLQQENQFEQRKRRLNLSMGRSPMAQIALPEFSYNTPTYPALDQAKTAAMQNNKTLRDLELNIRQSQLSLNLAQANFLPDLNGFFSYDRNGYRPKDLYNDLNKNWSYTIGLRMSIPIYNSNGGSMKTRPLIQRRKAELSIAQKNYTDAKLQVEMQVENLIQQLDTYEEIIELNELNLQSAEEDLRLAREQYNVGQATLLDVLDAQANLTNARRVLVYTKFDAKTVEAELNRVMGTIEG